LGGTGTAATFRQRKSIVSRRNSRTRVSPRRTPVSFSIRWHASPTVCGGRAANSSSSNGWCGVNALAGVFQ
jgi:hypothetical protein